MQPACSRGTHLSNAYLHLGELKAFLYNAEEGSRGHQSPIDVGLGDVGLYAKCIRSVHKPCSS